MEHLKKIKECMVEEVYEQLNHNLEHVDTHELGEAVDMIKDIAEAMYYCSVVDAMEESQKDKDQERRTIYYTERIYPPMYDGTRGRKPTEMNDWDTDRTKSEMDSYLRDAREGRSGMTRRTYMEGKATKAPKEKQMKELEQYVQELSVDIAEMIRDATPEEKQMLQKKLTSLATKIDNV